MIIPLSKLVKDFNLNIRGVIHIGAHYGQEYKDYAEQGIKNMLFFEPVISNYQKLLNTLPINSDIKTFNLALGNEVGTKDMFIETANKGMSCSLLEPGTHLTSYPHITFNNKETVRINKLDNIYFNRELYNMINIDVQGYELEVFKGAVKTLDHIEIIYSEVNNEEVYKGCAKVEELDLFLAQWNFKRVETNWLGVTWGDAIYLKEKWTQENTTVAE